MSEFVSHTVSLSSIISNLLMVVIGAVDISLSVSLTLPHAEKAKIKTIQIIKLNNFFIFKPPSNYNPRFLRS